MQIVQKLRCANCRKLLAEQAGPGTVIKCARCKHIARVIV